MHGREILESIFIFCSCRTAVYAEAKLTQVFLLLLCLQADAKTVPKLPLRASHAAPKLFFLNYAVHHWFRKPNPFPPPQNKASLTSPIIFPLHPDFYYSLLLSLTTIHKTHDLIGISAYFFSVNAVASEHCSGLGSTTARQCPPSQASQCGA